MLLDLLGLFEEGAAAVDTLRGRARRLVRPFRAPKVEPGKPLPQPARPEQPGIAAWKQLTPGRVVSLSGGPGVRAGGAALVLLKKGPATPILELPVLQQPVEARTFSPAITRPDLPRAAAAIRFGAVPGRHLVKEAVGGLRLRTGGAARIETWGLVQREDEDDLLEIA